MKNNNIYVIHGEWLTSAEVYRKSTDAYRNAIDYTLHNYHYENLNGCDVEYVEWCKRAEQLMKKKNITTEDWSELNRDPAYQEILEENDYSDRIFVTVTKIK